MVALGLLLLTVLCGIHGSLAAVQVNPNIGYTRWPSNTILVRTTGVVNTYPEGQNLQNAMNQISMDLGYCVNFTLYNPNLHAGQPSLVVQNRYTGSTTAASICTTFPGYTATGGANGQVAIMFGSQTGPTTGGCLDNQRDAMRVLVNAMGLRSEFLRNDRAAYMTFPTSVDRNTLVAPSLQTFQIFSDTNRYNDTVAIQSTPFDYNSITMITGAKYAGTSTPVFTIPGGTQVGQLARLSIQDCATLKNMYQCSPPGYGPTPSCVDPYSSTSGISLTPSPTTLTRTIQCATSASTASTTGTPYQIGAFVVTGLNCDQNSQATPQITPTLTGLSARLTKYSAPITPNTFNNVVPAYTGAGACAYVLEFTYAGLPAAGQLNQQITVNVQQTIAGVSSTVAGLPVTLNLNCAPQFTSVTAFQVGPAPFLATSQTRTLLGTAPNNNIQVVNNNAPPISSPSYSNTAANILPYLVQYQATFGQPLVMAVGPPAVNKVFVNCVGTIPTSGTISLPVAGTNVIGQVQATDPEGGDVQFYIWSERLVATATPGERFDVTQDGIITMSSRVPSPSPNAATTGNTPLDDSAAVAQTLAVNVGVATTTANDVNSYRNILITAVDSLGGKSTMQISLYLNCGASQ